jgi:hypothetical protein
MSTAFTLAFFDALALIVFSIIGIFSHNRAFDIAALLRNALPLLVVWFVLTPLLGTYQPPSWRRLWIAWLVCVPLGIILRTVILGHPRGSEFFSFLGVTMVATSLLLGGFRWAAYWLAPFVG